MLDNSIYNLSKDDCLDISSEEYNNMRLFFELLSKSSSFAHKAHKELQRLS